MVHKFEREMKSEIKRDSLFPSDMGGDDDSTQKIDAFKTGDTFFAAGLRDGSEPPKIETKGVDEGDSKITKSIRKKQMSPKYSKKAP